MNACTWLGNFVKSWGTPGCNFPWKQWSSKITWELRFHYIFTIYSGQFHIDAKPECTDYIGSYKLFFNNLAGLLFQRIPCSNYCFFYLRAMVINKSVKKLQSVPYIFNSQINFFVSLFCTRNCLNRLICYFIQFNNSKYWPLSTSPANLQYLLLYSIQ